MAIELRLQKTTKTPWGFRLAGGVEYEVPLTVIKVTEGSIAENAGMQTGDLVVRVNDIPTAGLTHPQAHDVLLSAGNDFVIAVRRGDLSHLPPKLLLYETSVENAEDIIHGEVFRREDDNDQDLNITDEEIADIIGEQVHLTSQKVAEKSSTEVSAEIRTTHEQMEVSQEVSERHEQMEVSQEISMTHTQTEVSKVLLSEETQTADAKKWSTFLQKPNNPKPKPKNDSESAKVPPYTVIIKKQPKKEEKAAMESINKMDEAQENENVANTEEKQETDEEQVQTEGESIDNIDKQDNLDENENITIEEEPEQIEVENSEESQEKHAENEEEREVENNEQQIDNGIYEKRLSINLEEQLAQVQKQLLALSQLPSAIQQTLNAVTQQLSEIVTMKQMQEEEVTIEAKAIVQEEITEEYMEMPEHVEKALSTLEEESIEQYEEEEEIKEGEIRDDAFEESARNESEDEQALFEALEQEIEEEERQKQEEHEIQRMEQEKLEKKEKERRPSQPLTPLERPIILPGGRKWSQPGDAIKNIRRPSFTDEKIANTINTFSEVICGRTMGINFLKYQPPPKNLDYLQRSAVYRLVHDIEPPAKGIIARDIKILAEQDYYSEQQEEKDLPAQMER